MKVERSLATILFTDIVGSTERAAELGDRDWHALLDRHHAWVRREIRRFGGREVNTTGDGFLATFERPARAIRCAWAIREAVRELGLEVRSGLHAGEVEGQARDLSGIIVHTGARVAAQAHPGEILVSGTVRDLVAGSGFGFEDRGVHALKGVPGEWRLHAVETVPSGASSSEDWRWIPELGRRRVLGATVVAIVVVAGAIAVATRDTSRIDPEDAVTAGAAPGIAVLPFTVNGPGLEVWREGVIDLVSANIDGVGGLRAIDSRTVLVRWNEVIEESGTPDLEHAQEVGRRTGARYALLGSATALGSEVRLVADIYDLENGESLGQTQVQGAPDSVYALVDRLSIGVLETVLTGKTDLPQISLARVTTTSLPALKAYLEGETLYRRSDFDAAIPVLQRAVEADSTFALAHYRLSFAYAWTERIGSDQSIYHLEQAARHVDRLPEREAILVRANLAVERDGTLDGLEPLRQGVRKYPDDVELWFTLGETYTHLGDAALSTDAQLDEAWERAIELDPSLAPLYIHPTEVAFARGDSARAFALGRTYLRLAPNGEFAPAFRHALALLWGPAESRKQAVEAVDTLDFESADNVMVYALHPRFRPLGSEIAARNRAREEWWGSWGATRGVIGHLIGGDVDSVLATLEDPRMHPATRRGMLFVMHEIGIPLEEARLVELRTPAYSDSLPSLNPAFYAAALAAEDGRWSEFDQASAYLRRQAERLYADGDSARARYAKGLFRAAEGYAAWKRGEEGQARTLLEVGQREATTNAPFAWANPVMRYWLGTLALQQGRPADAARYFSTYSGFHRPLVADRLGQAYEAAGDREKAREAYELFVMAWEGGDPTLQPRVEAARQALARLPTPLRRESP